MRSFPPQAIQQLRAKVFAWYRGNKRDLPWRRMRDPYRILVAEVMLQQTQVDRVLPKYDAFVAVLPNFAALACCDTRTLLRLWSGLGYNARALRLRESATVVVEQFGARLPKNEESLLALSGIGPYTARAVQIFAWNKDVVCVDTNIRRIFIHELGLSENVSAKELEDVAVRCAPKGRARDWHNALMDYGALKKTARATGVRPLSRQSTFKNSRRYYRGQIVKLLTKERAVSLAQLKKRFTASPYDIKDIVIGLEKEGFARVVGRTVRME